MAAVIEPERPEPEAQRASRSFGREVLARFLRHRLAVVGSLTLLFLLLLVVLGPLVIPHDPAESDFTAFNAPPSADHWLGTDSIGRDVLARMVHGGRVSLSVGLVATAIGAAIGVPLGLYAGFQGGRVDAVLMRLADVFMSFPSIMLILVLVAVVGPSIWSVMIILGILGWPHFARLMRGGVLVAREREFVEAARALGVSTATVMFRHILPNTFAPVLVAATFRTAQAILLEASLSFLGMGVQPPQASWGNMLYDAQSITTVAEMPWIWMPPGFAIVLAVLAINFIGDGLRDALDPKMKV